MIYGSSYPVREVWLTEGPAFVQALDLPQEDSPAMPGGCIANDPPANRRKTICMIPRKAACSELMTSEQAA